MKNYSKFEDAVLLSLLKTEDRYAFTEIYHRYWARMYVFARKIIRNQDEATDIVQEVFTYLWQKRSEIEIHGALAAYLYTSVRFRTLSVIARSKVHDRYLESLSNFIDQGKYITDESVRENELKASIEKAISKLPKRMRLIFELSRDEHLNYKMVGDQLNLSDKTIRNQVCNAVKILKHRLKKYL